MPVRSVEESSTVDCSSLFDIDDFIVSYVAIEDQVMGV